MVNFRIRYEEFINSCPTGYREILRDIVEDTSA